MLIFELLLACTASGPAEPVVLDEAGDPVEHATPQSVTSTLDVADRPNFLVVTLDTVRVDALGCYGNKIAKTPVLDTLAQESTRFSRAYTVTPLTIPAHSSLHSGLLPPRHGVRDNGDYFLSDQALTMAERLHDAGWATMASVGAEVTSHHWGFDQGFDTFFDDMGAARTEEGNRWRVERPGDLVIDDALSWLSEERDQPWFAWVHMFDAHHPYEAPEEFAQRFPNHPYIAEVGWLDFQLGRLLADLESRGELERTWVLVMSDHGEGMGNHGEILHGALLYNATTRIPFIVRPPGGRTAPAFVHFPVSLVDVMPTVLAQAGVPAPADLDGQDLGPWVDPNSEAQAPLSDRAVYVESLYAWRHFGWAPQRALVLENHKLIDSTTAELYGRDDYNEAHNLAAEDPATHDAMRAQVRAMAQSWTAEEGLAGDADLSADRLAQLEALGYVTGGDRPTDEPGFDAGLPDPVGRLPVLREVEQIRQLLQKNEGEEALVRLDDLLAREPGLSEAASMRANVLTRMGRLDEAQAAYEAMIDPDRPSANVETSLAHLALMRQDPQTALLHLERALTHDPSLPSAWVSYLHTLAIQGNPMDLETALTRAGAQVPHLVEVQVMRGVLAFQSGDADGSKALFELALERDPSQVMANHHLGLIARQSGRDGDAETHLLEEVRLAPPAAQSRRALVDLYAGQKRYEEELAQLDAILAHSTDDILSMHFRAQTLFNLRRYDESHQAVNRCLLADPTYAMCTMLLANVFSKLGDKDKAQATYEEALRQAEQKKR